MTDRPIIFNADMIRALMDGRKTQTRRILSLPAWTEGMQCTGRLVEYQPDVGFERHGLEFIDAQFGLWDPDINPNGRSGAYLRISQRPGDRLWVRETCYAEEAADGTDGVRYPADDCFVPIQNTQEAGESWGKLFHYRGKPKTGRSGHTSPSIHMPRWASRLTLIVTDVRVQRLHDTTLGEICAEGLARTIYDFKPVLSGFQAFLDYWDNLHGEGAHTANPWVCATTFTVHRCNIDQMEAA